MEAVRPLRRRQPRPRGGFTLIELLVVIVIIGILIALLFPAISGAIRTTRDAQVVAEMANFDKALVEFKNRYGVDVPSFIVLYEEGEGGTGTANWGADTSSPLPSPQDAYRRESRAFIRQVWPDFDFTLNRDIDGDGVGGEVHILNGSECLVFFLGGVFRRGADNTSLLDDTLIGFAANPQNPFDATSTNNRVGPFFEFSVNRLVDVDGDGLPEYVDPLPGQTRPYVYASSYGGRGYQPFGQDYDPGNTATIGNADDEIEPTLGLRDLYRQDDENPATLGPYLNPQTYQLISPGTDGDYGTGGEYNGEGVPATRAAERDNITNFKGGRLN